jgi:lysophospholipase L1-like esterase
MIRRITLAIVGALVVVGTIGTAPATAASKATYYLALGDSVAQGGQPIGGPFSPYASPGYNHGYPEELEELVGDEYQQLRLENLACGGQSTRTVIEGAPWCPYTAGSQLEQAEAFLEAHPGEVAFITITIGANDVIGTETDCLDDATITFDIACVQAQLPSIQANIAEIVQRLQAAAPGVPIVGSNYYNPLLGAWVLVPGPVGQFLAQASVAPAELLNSGIEAAYLPEGASVADLYGAFDSTNFADLVATDWGLVPTNVANACTWTWFCSKQYPGDVHPNNPGHEVIAQAFAEELGS